MLHWPVLYTIIPTFLDEASQKSFPLLMALQKCSIHRRVWLPWFIYSVMKSTQEWLTSFSAEEVFFTFIFSKDTLKYSSIHSFWLSSEQTSSHTNHMCFKESQECPKWYLEFCRFLLVVFHIVERLNLKLMQTKPLKVQSNQAVVLNYQWIGNRSESRSGFVTSVNTHQFIYNSLKLAFKPKFNILSLFF